jgi:2-oxo-4-hydroxy-4-carboxy--5-ureidoimidazoline (OHCU) decarboxylase
MNSTFSPKDRFLSSPYAAEHLAWSRSEASRAAIEAALSHIATTRKGANLMLLEGAADLATELLNIAEPQTKSSREDRSTIYSSPIQKFTTKPK